VYAGKVGTEFDQDLIRRLGEKLARLETPVSPFAEDGLPRRGVHWVKPKLIAQIGFTEWTGEASCDTLDSSACGMTSGRKISCLRADVR
jgi:ATP-dependent DNA ligase